MPFRFQGKHLLLTYSQVENASAFTDRPDSHLDLVSTVVRPPDVYRLGRESHEDGGTHFHVFISWENRVSFRNQHALDFAGVHPNIAPIRKTPENAWRYSGKDDDIIHEFGRIDGPASSPKGNDDSVWAAALDADTAEQFLCHIRRNAPRHYVLYYEQLLRFVEAHFTPPTPVYESPRFTLVGAERVDDWFQQSGIFDGRRPGSRPKSICLHGPSRTGKTVYARSLGVFLVHTPGGPLPPRPVHILLRCRSPLGRGLAVDRRMPSSGVT